MKIAVMSYPSLHQVDAQVNVRFATGAYYDPPGKFGLHHLMEHLLFDQQRVDKANKQEVAINSDLGQTSLAFTLEGAANPDVLDYGVWPFIGELSRMVSFPFNHQADMAEATKIQRSLIQKELLEILRSAKYRKQSIRNGILHPPDSPIHANLKQSFDCLGSLTVDDVYSLAERVLVSQGALISAVVYGNQETGRFLADMLEREFGRIPARRPSMDPIDPSSLTKLHPDLEKGGVTLKRDDFVQKYGTRDIDFYWFIETEDYTSERAELALLAPALYRIVRAHLRNNGVEYEAEMRLDDWGFAISLPFNTSPSTTITALSQVIRSELRPIITSLIKSMTDEDIREIIATEQLKQHALPLSFDDRFAILTRGLSRYGRFIDADRVKRQRADITSEDLKSLHNSLTAQPPTILIF